MRIGTNPAKNNKSLQLNSYHRIIVPVYIPNLEEAYFKNSFQILKYCLESLLKTIHEKSKISIINNGSCKIIRDYLIELKSNNDKIDQLLDCDDNLGKINAIYSITKSNLEVLFTVTDADVYFKNGWQQAVEEVFVAIPYAGMVSPVPAPVAYKNSLMNSTYYYGITRNAINVDDVIDADALLKFQKSIDSPLYQNIHLQKQLTLKVRGFKAAFGCGHFVATLRKEVFEAGPSSPSIDKIGGQSLKNYIDKPNDDAGFLRLATIDNYAYHLGNVPEGWMEDLHESQQLLENLNKKTQIIPLAQSLSKLQQTIGRIFYKLLIRTKPIKKQYLRFLGINDSEF